MYYILLVCIIIIIILILFYNKQNENFNNNFKINKTYVINLDSRKDRLQSIDKDLKKINLEYERFSACDGKKIEIYSKDIDKYFDKNNKLTPGQIGCALSHIKIWEKAIKDNNKYTLVLEDDAIIPSNFWKKINNLDIKKFKLLFLQLSNIKCKKKKKNLYYPIKDKGNWGTTAYIIHNNFAKKILKSKINSPIDVHLSNFYDNDVLLVYPNIIKPNFDSFSNLWGGTPNKNMIKKFNSIKIYK